MEVYAQLLLQRILPVGRGGNAFPPGTRFAAFILYHDPQIFFLRYQQIFRRGNLTNGDGGAHPVHWSSSWPVPRVIMRISHSGAICCCKFGNKWKIGSEAWKLGALLVIIWSFLYWYLVKTKQGWPHLHTTYNYKLYMETKPIKHQPQHNNHISVSW